MAIHVVLSRGRLLLPPSPLPYDRSIVHPLLWAFLSCEHVVTLASNSTEIFVAAFVRDFTLFFNCCLNFSCYHQLHRNICVCPHSTFTFVEYSFLFCFSLFLGFWSSLIILSILKGCIFPTMSEVFNWKKVYFEAHGGVFLNLKRTKCF